MTHRKLTAHERKQVGTGAIWLIAILALVSFFRIIFSL